MSNTDTPSEILGLPFGLNEIGWKGVRTGSRFQTDGNLFHVSNPACGDLINRTQALLFKFNITSLSDVISGVELRVVAQRNGRATDEQIQLSYQDQPLGNNNFQYMTDEDGHLPLHNDATYGGPTDLWGAELTPEILQDPSFGVILKFQGHPYYPHSSGMFVDHISLTIY
jgi:hypothetical protein